MLEMNEKENGPLEKVRQCEKCHSNLEFCASDSCLMLTMSAL